MTQKHVWKSTHSCCYYYCSSHFSILFDVGRLLVSLSPSSLVVLLHLSLTLSLLVTVVAAERRCLSAIHLTTAIYQLLLFLGVVAVAVLVFLFSLSSSSWLLSWMMFLLVLLYLLLWLFSWWCLLSPSSLCHVMIIVFCFCSHGSCGGWEEEKYRSRKEQKRWEKVKYNNSL